MAVITPDNLSFNVRGKCGDRVYAVTDGVQWSRAYFTPNHPLTDFQVNTWDAFGKISMYFGALTGSIKKKWADLSESRGLPKPNFFCSRGMVTYRRQLGIGTQADSVEVDGIYPNDVWIWE